ncbi:Clc-like protein 2 [Aphelenchoides bicaudatus]|nr:Clc-like protein 2 [Aphelenchoides bicaudatus]
MLQQVHVFQVAALVFAILGFISGFIALLTPSWQTVYAREIMQWIQSGLFMSCQTRPNGMYVCSYAFSNVDYNYYANLDVLNLQSPPFYPWQRNLLLMLLLAQSITFVAFTAFFCSFHVYTQRIGPVIFMVFIAITFALHAGATVIFLVFTQMVEYRFYKVSVSGTYEKQFGYSFHVELFCMTCYLISLIFAIVHLVRINISQPSRSNYSTPIAQHEFYGNNSYDSRRLDPYETQLAMKSLPAVPGYYR